MPIRLSVPEPIFCKPPGPLTGELTFIVTLASTLIVLLEVPSRTPRVAAMPVPLAFQRSCAWLLVSWSGTSVAGGAPKFVSCCAVTTPASMIVLPV